MLIKEIKNLFTAMIGATTITYEKANEIIKVLVEKGKVTIEEGKELSEELKREFKDKKNSVKTIANETINEIKPFSKNDIYGMFEEFNISTKEELNELREKIVKIEEKMKDNEK